ncbi:hypothetical protein HaLaN_31833, partial [Haematococcus lacustris]
RIGESKQRPLELCRWDDLEALPPVGKEYQQGYKRLNGRLPKWSGGLAPGKSATGVGLVVIKGYGGPGKAGVHALSGKKRVHA